ncbi:MAG: IS110 family transposase [Elusimicrobia bacterium]|nr:IS110 family transposase [Candidatus Obscuribacterium magneticum]
MNKSNLFVGLDVHKESIDVALAPEGSTEVRAYGTIGGDLVSVDRMVRKLLAEGVELEVAYEAGPCGFEIYRYFKKRNIPCLVVAPSRIPRKPADRVKTDRRDAQTLARLHRAGELKGIYVPTEEDESLRDLTRAREHVMVHYGRARKQLLMFLLRHGVVYTGKTNWKADHLNWLSRINLPHPAQQVVFQEHLHAIQESHLRLERFTQQIEEQMNTWRWKPVVEALMGMRGVSLVVAAGIVAELGDMRRFSHPRQVMSYLGLVPSEYSSGDHRRQGAITKTGNVHVRRLLTEAAWAYIRGPKVSPIIRQRQQDLPQPIIDIAWKAQLRLCKKYRRMVLRGKNGKVAAVAVARELVAFMWDISRNVLLQERQMIAA